MKLTTELKIWMAMLVLLCLTLMSVQVFAGGTDCRKGYKPCDTTDIDVRVNADAQSDASAESSSTSDASSDSSAVAEGGSVGDITFNEAEIPANTTHNAKIKIENTPDQVQITPGSRNRCVAHIGANFSVPGLGTGLNIPLPGKECRKLSYFDRMVAQGDNKAAEIIFCSLKDIRKEFRVLELDCRETLSIHTEPEPVQGVLVPEGEYQQLLLAQQQAEEFEAQQQRVLEQLEKYDERIDEAEAEKAFDEAEIERLKRDAARQAEEDRKNAERRAKARAIKEAASE